MEPPEGSGRSQQRNIILWSKAPCILVYKICGQHTHIIRTRYSTETHQNIINKCANIRLKNVYYTYNRRTKSRKAIIDNQKRRTYYKKRRANSNQQSGRGENARKEARPPGIYDRLERSEPRPHKGIQEEMEPRTSGQTERIQPPFP